ncbi:MAG: type II toxin-antitoxin system VapB family antitoxin [Gammaproteobacteria bacterium]|nr:type II toxin-antitoxin system VapB family antitoxin [Gammaproteobacteria bacterium]
MKTTVDIPEAELSGAMRFTGAETKREAVVSAIVEFNRRQRMAELTRYAGTCANLITAADVQAARRRS